MQTFEYTCVYIHIPTWCGGIGLDGDVDVDSHSGVTGAAAVVSSSAGAAGGNAVAVAGNAVAQPHNPTQLNTHHAPWPHTTECVAHHQHTISM